MRRFWLGASAVATTCVLLFTPALNPAYATTYPTWQDVLNARNDVAAKEKAIADLQAILGGLNDAADKANQEAQRVGNIYQEAQQAYDEAAYKADQLQAQADAAKQAAEDSRIRAGQFISELARVGSVNISTSLLADSSGAKDLLSRLGFASVIAAQADGVHLGATDGSLRDARRLLPAKTIIGASCYNDLPLARQAIADGASYVAFGACFASTTKPAARRVSPTQLAMFRQALGSQVAICGIGGITQGAAGIITVQTLSASIFTTWQQRGSLGGAARRGGRLFPKGGKDVGGAAHQGCPVADQPVAAGGPGVEGMAGHGQNLAPLLQRGLGGLGLARARQVPAQQFARMAVDDQGQHGPTIASRPHPAQVRRPAFVRRSGHRRQSLDAGTESHRPLLHLPAHQLEDPLHRVLVEPQQVQIGRAHV